MSPPIPDRTMTLAPRAGDTEASEDPRGPCAASPISGPRDDPERYQLIREHARGGLGRVVRAVDRRLGRTVAVKELLRHRSTDGDESRFVREALITARLEHPGIVPVHEAGRWPNGEPYYVMKLVEGRTLKELIAGRDHLRDRLHLLPHAIAIADAVGYAHSQGVIHRDLKPSNVIVGEFGETLVIDWGLARDRRAPELPEPSGAASLASGSGTETVSGKVIGTPAYMAPEQARGETVDERADVYAIGAVLYELLAGAPPHHDATPRATLDRVLAGPPRPLAVAAPHAPRELVTIVRKAMARTPGDRYPNASALAEDLRRFQTGKLVSAHSYSTWSLIRKRLAQHRGVVAVAAASAIALAGIGVGSFRRVVAERNIAQQNDAHAQDARAQAERRQRELVLLQARTALRKDPTATVAWLKAGALDAAELAQVQDVVDEAVALGVARHVFRTASWVFDAAFTPDGRDVVTIGNDGALRRFELATGAEATLGRAASGIEQMVITHDGSVVVTAGARGEITAWPIAGGAPRVLVRGGPAVTSLVLSSDGARVLVTRKTGAAEVVALAGGAPIALGDPTVARTAIASAEWTRQVAAPSPTVVVALDLGTAGPVTARPIAHTAKAIKGLFVAPRGDRVLIHDGAVVWTVPYAGGPLTRLAAYDGNLEQAAWSPDGATIALAGSRHDVVLVTPRTGEVRELRGHGDAIYGVQWSHDGRRLLSASDDATARVWTVLDGTAIVLRGHDDDVYRARFSRDERQVVTSSLDGSVRVWELERPGARAFVEGRPIEQLELDGDRALVTTSSEVARWNLRSGHREPVFSWAGDSLGVALPSPDGERLLVLAPDWSIEVRRRAGPTIVLRGHRATIAHVAFSRDGATLYTSSLDGTLRRWDLATGAGTVLLDGDHPIPGFAVARDGRVVALTGTSMRLITPDGRSAAIGAAGAGCFMSGEFEPIRDRLIVRGCDMRVLLLDGAALDQAIELPSGTSGVSRIAVSPDGAQIAGAMSDRTVRVWDAATGRVLRVLRGHTDLVNDVAFSPDGKILASASYDHTVRLWDVGSEDHRVLRGHQRSVQRVAWRDARHLVTASRDGTIRVWDVPALAPPRATELAAQLERATSARIDRDRPTTQARASDGA